MRARPLLGTIIGCSLITLVGVVQAEGPRASDQMPPRADRMLRAHATARELTRQFYATSSREDSPAERRNDGEIRRMFAKTFTGTTAPRVVRLQAKSRAAFKIPEGTSSRYWMNLQGMTMDSPPLVRSASAEKVGAASVDGTKLGMPVILLADDKGRLDIWSNLVHETSHLRFGQYLERNIARLATAFPSFIKKGPEGYSVRYSLYHLLSEWHAYEMGYRAYETGFGKALSREAGGRQPKVYGQELPDERVRHGAIAQFLLGTPASNDPALRQAAQGKTLSEFLKYGEHGSRGVLTRHRANP